MTWVDYDFLETPASAYPNFRYEVFTDLYGQNFKPYVAADGVPRLGPAIDLRIESNLEAAATVILGGAPNSTLLAQLQAEVDKTYDGDQDTLLVNRLNNVLEAWEQTHPGTPTKFELAGASEAKDVLALVMAQIEEDLDDWSDVGIPLSEERAVVASLLYQGYDVSDITNAMLFDGDRAAAWMAVRYLETGDDPTNAKAAKRFYQSGRFELYNNPGDVEYTEAEDVGLAYMRVRKTILPYEDKFDPAKIGMGDEQFGGHDRIAAFLQPAIGVVAKEYFAEIGHADELLFVNNARSPFYGDNPNDDFNSKKNDDDLIVSRLTTGESILGGAGNDVIISLGGNDRVEGGAGNDNLYGGEGADKLFGGNGNDKLWGGGGKDQLEGGTGNDTYILGGDDELDPDGGGSPSLIGASNSDKIVEDKNGGMDTAVIQVNNGNFNLRNIEKFKLSADMSGNFTIKLNEFDAFTLSNGQDDVTLVINRLQKTPIEIKTGGGDDTVHIKFENGVDPSQVLDGKGLTARFKFTDLGAGDTIDLHTIGIKDIIMTRDHISVDKGYYLLAPGAKLDLMDGNQIDKTYNNYTDNWFVVKCGDDTPFGPEFIGNIDKTHFDI